MVNIDSDRQFSRVYSRMRQYGFSLVELMIVVAIVAILASIAMPSYQDYITRGRIPDATSGLAIKRVRLEAFYDNNRTYVGAPDCANDATTSQFFVFSCANAGVNTYTLQAVGVGPMAGFTYTINETNVRATTSVPANWTSNAACWVVRKGGTC